MSLSQTEIMHVISYCHINPVSKESMNKHWLIAAKTL